MEMERGNEENVERNIVEKKFLKAAGQIRVAENQAPKGPVETFVAPKNWFGENVLR